jgi:hypothetical protein
MKIIRNLAGLIAISLIFLMTGCDSGEQAIDEVTGNRAVKQYHKTTEDLEKVANQQEQRYDGIAEEENR